MLAHNNNLEANALTIHYFVDFVEISPDIIGARAHGLNQRTKYVREDDFFYWCMVAYVWIRRTKATACALCLD